VAASLRKNFSAGSLQLQRFLHLVLNTNFAAASGIRLCGVHAAQGGALAAHQVFFEDPYRAVTEPCLDAVTNQQERQRDRRVT
jgi:hypothetical protein